MSAIEGPLQMEDRADAENPWPGLRAYDESEQDFFYGRPRESLELLRLVKRDALTVFFGISGIGKSSVLQAGLFPLLRQEGYLPVHIRLDFADPQLDLSGGLGRTVEVDIKAHKLKVNEAYSAFSFRTKAQEQAYEKTKVLPKGMTSIYNEDAVRFVVQKLQEMSTGKGTAATN